LIPSEEDEEKEFSSSVPSQQRNVQRSEVHVVTWNNDDLEIDALHVLGFEHYKAKYYSLAHVPFIGSSYAGGHWVPGDEPLYYVVSPKDVVIAKPKFDVVVLPLPKSTVVAGLMTMAVPTHMEKKRHALANVTNQRPQNGSNLDIFDYMIMFLVFELWKWDYGYVID
nr:vacuolar protein sorting-associated protein 41 homolog [Tanacetum cinerariifolium]